MSVELVKVALANTDSDEAVSREFLLAWPLVESILEAFAIATGLPIFAFLSERFIYQSSPASMPPFCSMMLSNPDTLALCKQDALRRVSKIEPDVEHGIQYCHAGRINGRREIDTGLVGTLTILFGAKPPQAIDALKRQETVINDVALKHPVLASQLRGADHEDVRESTLGRSDSMLMDAIAEIVQRLLRATASAQALAINMAHELSLTLLSMGLLATLIQDLASENARDGQNLENMTALTTEYRHLLAECKLGLYVARNFLSHASEARYRRVTKPRFTMVNMAGIVEEMIDLYKSQAEKKQITFDVRGLEFLPSIYAAEMEIRRLLHNALSNAVKYSYHSVPGAHRTIRVYSRVPYDPGFKERRFSIVIENYGLGLAKDERGLAFRAGFRGRQATKEVPIGAGIGLSEAEKIMKMHHGSLRLRSEEVHLRSADDPTFLTTLELIFPYPEVHQ